METFCQHWRSAHFMGTWPDISSADTGEVHNGIEDEMFTHPHTRIRLHWVGGKPSASPSSLYVSGRSASSPFLKSSGNSLSFTTSSGNSLSFTTSSGNSLFFTATGASWFAALQRIIAPRQLKARVRSCAVLHGYVCALSACSKSVVHGFGHACGCTYVCEFFTGSAIDS